MAKLPTKPKPEEEFHFRPVGWGWFQDPKDKIVPQQWHRHRKIQ